jgi:polar amino acid transport system substrate-binding protein
MVRAALRCTAGLIACVAMMSGAMAQTALERARRDGVIRVGFPNQVPYAFATEKGELTGADAEVAKLVVQKMGIGRMDGVLTEFAALIPGLKANRFDIVLAMFINPQRCEQVAFSEPVYGIGQAIVVAKGNPLKLTSYDHLASDKKARVAVMAGAVQANYMKKLGVEADRTSVLPDMLSAASAVKAGRIDAFAISSLPARRLVASMGPDAGVEVAEISPDPMIDGRPARGYSAFAFRKEDDELLKAFNAALAGILGTEAHVSAITPFGFDRTNLPDRSAAELCK